MEGAVEAGERAAREVRQEADSALLLSPLTGCHLPFQIVPLIIYLLIDVRFSAPHSTHEAYLWPAGPWSVQNPHNTMATFFQVFLFTFSFCFFQVLNALGKLAAKDIWIQEPEAEVSFSSIIDQESHIKKSQLLASDVFVDATLQGRSRHWILQIYFTTPYSCKSFFC